MLPSIGGGEYSNYFLTGCEARGLKPLPISKDFSHSKNDWIDSFFFRNSRKSRPISKGLFRLKTGWFYTFFANFVKWDPPLSIFLTKMGPMFKDFWWKSNPFGWHIPICLIIWVPRGLQCHTSFRVSLWKVDSLFWKTQFFLDIFTPSVTYLRAHMTISAVAYQIPVFPWLEIFVVP